MTRLAKSIVWVLSVGGLLAAPALGQSSVELKGSARVEPGTAVTLAEVATLSGDEAIALGSVVVLAESPTRPSKLSIQDVRRTLTDHANVNWGRITLRGSTCTLAATARAPKSNPTPAIHQAPATIDPNSIRKAVSDRIARILQADTANLRLTFDSADDEVLNLSVTNRTLEIKPTASSDRLPLALTLYEGDRIIASKSIRVAVLVRRTVVIAAAAKSRGQTIERGDVTIEEQWVGPNLKAALPETVIGAAAQGRIAAGQIIGIGDVVVPSVVNKGDQVAVSCVSGSVVVTTKARAMAAGRVGDVIPFQGLEDKRTFSARLSGKGRAVVTADAAPEQPAAQEIQP